MKYSIITKGMGCPHCIKKVTKAMEELGARIEKVELNDIIVFSDKTEADIRAAIEAKGFEVVSVMAE
ncbi:MAG: mercury transporter [Clostridia bacterium]|nr:mercury transporter [Clostridia bacterium]